MVVAGKFSNQAEDAGFKDCAEYKTALFATWGNDKGSIEQWEKNTRLMYIRPQQHCVLKKESLLIKKALDCSFDGCWMPGAGASGIALQTIS